MKGFVVDSKERYVNPYKRDYSKCLDEVPEYLREKIRLEDIARYENIKTLVSDNVKFRFFKNNECISFNVKSKNNNFIVIKDINSLDLRSGNIFIIKNKKIYCFRNFTELEKERDLIGLNGQETDFIFTCYRTYMNTLYFKYKLAFKKSVFKS